MDVAYPGDIIGLVSGGTLTIGDTVYAGRRATFPRIPAFPPEHFARFHERSRPRDPDWVYEAVRIATSLWAWTFFRW